MVHCFKALLRLTLFINPFLLDIPVSKEESVEYVEEVQNLLRQTVIRPELEKIYPKNWEKEGKYKPFEDFYRRSMRGIEQRLVDRKQGWLPEKKLRIFKRWGERLYCLKLSVQSELSGTDRIVSGGIGRDRFSRSCLLSYWGISESNWRRGALCGCSLLV